MYNFDLMNLGHTLDITSVLPLIGDQNWKGFISTIRNKRLYRAKARFKSHLGYEMVERTVFDTSPHGSRYRFTREDLELVFQYNLEIYQHNANKHEEECWRIVWLAQDQFPISRETMKFMSGMVELNLMRLW